MVGITTIPVLCGASEGTQGFMRLQVWFARVFFLDRIVLCLFWTPDLPALPPECWDCGQVPSQQALGSLSTGDCSQGSTTEPPLQL